MARLKLLPKYRLLIFITQHIRALPIYGQNARYICHPLITDILRYKEVDKFRSKTYKLLPNYTFSTCKIRFVDNLLNTKTIILLNLAE